MKGFLHLVGDGIWRGSSDINACVQIISKNIDVSINKIHKYFCDKAGPFKVIWIYLKLACKFKISLQACQS
jgi:hypothetical protein